MQSFTIKTQQTIYLSKAEIKFIKEFDPASWNLLKSPQILRSLRDKDIYKTNYLDLSCYLTPFGKKVQQKILKAEQLK
jgi:hypothetical protein